MNITVKRAFQSVLVGAVILLLSACATSALQSEGRWYREDVSHIYFTDDADKLVVLGKDYHYVFESNDTLRQILSSDIKKHVHLVPIHNFFVDGNRNIKGKLTFEVNRDAPDDVKAWIRDKPEQYNSANRADVVLSGVRYDANAQIAKMTGYKTSREYRFSIWEEPSAGRQIASSLLSPITVAADGVLFLLASPLLLFCSCDGVAMQGGGH